VALTVIQNTPIAVPTKYRTAITAVDSATLNSATFTTTNQSAAPTVVAPVPVLPATGTPNAFVEARLNSNADAIGVTPVALNISIGPNGVPVVTVLGLGLEVVLSNTSPIAFTDGAGKFYTPAGIASTYGSRGSGPFSSGIVTHVAWLVTTAPAATADLYAWQAG
jgi:hypothetical protein